MKTREEHGIPNQFNIYTRDTESVVTGYGKHARVMATVARPSGLYCRVDLLEGLREPTTAEILTVARKDQGARGRWVLESREPWENGISIDFNFIRKS